MSTESNANSPQSLIVELEEFPRKWGWLLALGVVMVLAGCVGLYFVTAVTLATVLLYGGMLFSGGILSLFYSIRVKESKWHAKLFNILLALLYVVASIIIFMNPVAASAALTLVLAALFFVIGVLRVIHGFRCRTKGWRWVLPVLLGVVNWLFAIIIILSWPISGLWVIGLFVSIELIMNGWMLTFTALVVRKLAIRAEEG